MWSRDKKAFTLIELLVAVTVFAVFISILAGSYLMITRAQRDTNELRKVYSEGRFLMDEMITSVRGTDIAYDCYAEAVAGLDSTCEGATSNGDEITGTTLAVMRNDGKRVIFKAEACESGEPCYVLKKLVQEYYVFPNMSTGIWRPSQADGYNPSALDGGFQELALENIEVEDVFFHIRPGLENSNVPAHVSIYLSLNGTSQLRDEVNFDVQTTVSLRDY